MEDSSNPPSEKTEKPISRVKKFSYWIFWWAAVSLLLFIASIVDRYFTDHPVGATAHFLNYIQGIDPILLAPAGALLLTAPFALMSSSITRKKDEREGQEDEEKKSKEAKLSEIQNEEKTLKSTQDGEIDLIRLWAVNNKRLDLYHGITTNQSEKSFKSSQQTMLIGFFVIAIAVIAAPFASSTLASVSIASIGAASGLISAYISSTFMKAQAAASKQLRQFFYHPVEISRMLSAERLLSKLDDEDKSKVARLIIEATLNVQLDEAKKDKPID